MPRRIVIAGLLLLALGADAATVEDGLRAFAEQDYHQASEIWLPLSEQGDARATFYLSLLYAQGKGVERNPALALEFLAAAAREGLAAAQFNLGSHYNRGDGVPEEPAQTVYWWRKASEQDMPRAQHNLAGLYLIGRGVDRDESMARYWYRRAAANGSMASAETLALLDRQQKKLPKDNGEGALSHAWVEAQPAQNFTLQLAAMDSIESVKKFLQHYKLPRQVAVYRYQAKGKQYYGISYGRFDTRRLAHAAAAELPAGLRRNGPWPRRFAEIQRLLR
jgi:uncharacterized protein